MNEKPQFVWNNQPCSREELEFRMVLEHAQTTLNVLGTTSLTLHNELGQKIIEAHAWIGRLAQNVERQLVDLLDKESKANAGK